MGLVEKLDELRGPRTDEAHHLRRVVVSQRPKVSYQPPLRRVLGQLVDRGFAALAMKRRAPGEKDPHRLVDGAPPKAGTRAARCEQRLVDVVMQDPAAMLEVEAREREGELLGQGVADRVRMAEPLALDDLDPTRVG